MENKLSFDGLRNAIKEVRDDLPLKLANQAQNYFTTSFDKQAFDGKAWQEVQRRTPGTPAFKYPKTKDLGRRTRMILIGKGSTKLRRAVSQSARVNPQRWPAVRLIVDLSYAKAHNEGTKKIPQRQFAGQTEELTRLQREKIQETLNKHLK